MNKLGEVKLRDKYFSIDWVQVIKGAGQDLYDGLCCPQSHSLHYAQTLTEQGHVYALNILIHEALHACLPDLKEDAVAETASSIAAMLADIGYVCKDWDDEDGWDGVYDAMTARRERPTADLLERAGLVADEPVKPKGVKGVKGKPTTKKA